jgi:hypothetical protein
VNVQVFCLEFIQEDQVGSYKSIVVCFFDVRHIFRLNEARRLSGYFVLIFTRGQLALLGLAASMALSSAETTNEFEAMINYGDLIRLRELILILKRIIDDNFTLSSSQICL